MKQNQVIAVILGLMLIGGCGKSKSKSGPTSEQEKITALETALAARDGEIKSLRAKAKTPASDPKDQEAIDKLKAQITELQAKLDKAPKGSTNDAELKKAKEELAEAQKQIETLKTTCNTAEGCKARTDVLGQTIRDLEAKVKDLEARLEPPPVGPPAGVIGKLPNGYEKAKKVDAAWTENVQQLSLRASVESSDTGQTITFIQWPNQNRLFWTRADQTTVLTGTDREKYSKEFTSPELKFEIGSNPAVAFALDGDAFVLEQTPVTLQAIDAMVAHVAGDNETQATFLFPPHQFVVQEASAPAPSPDALTLTAINRWTYDPSKTYAIFFKSPTINEVITPRGMRCVLLDNTGANPVELSPMQDGDWLKATYSALTYDPFFISCSGQGFLRQKAGETKDPATLIFNLQVVSRFRS